MSVTERAMDSIPNAFDPGDNGPGIIAANIVVAILATIAVGLRVVSRRMQRLSLEADDYTIFAALVGATVVPMAITASLTSPSQPSNMDSGDILAQYRLISLL
ncbi:MAG: hypothetical protein Q9211_000970 [Gyalolechia sp. 1 TL-2023]